jgi:hypothetical protein
VGDVPINVDTYKIFSATQSLGSNATGFLPIYPLRTSKELG